MSTINPVHTSCKSCVFAEYAGITQNGCAVGYLDKYRNKNIEILEVYDNEKEFYVINNKKCIGYRSSGWSSALSFQEKIKKFNDQNHLHYLMIVNLNQFSDDKSVDALIKSLLEISIKPKFIVFIRHQNNKNHPYEKIQTIITDSNVNCRWRIQTVLEVDKSFHDILYENLRSEKKYRFAMVVNGSTDLNSIVNRANQIVYENMDSFMVLSNSNKSAMLFSIINYRYKIVVEKKCLLDDESLITII